MLPVTCWDSVRFPRVNDFKSDPHPLLKSCGKSKMADSTPVAQSQIVLLSAKAECLSPCCSMRCANKLRAAPARNQNSPSACSSGVLEALRDDAAALGKLGHDLFVEPDIHLSRAVEAAFVGELLRKLLAGRET